jgi:glycosyltransferase involved in cell wall biosynthesis
VLAGAPGPAEPELRALADELGVAERVVMPDWLDAGDLEGLYALATCFVLASLAEGFGLPILEAMARGVPVACSDASTLPEVAGDAALLFDPHDQQAIDDSIARLLADAQLRARLIDAGRARAAEFTWKRTAELTRATYERVVAR